MRSSETVFQTTCVFGGWFEVGISKFVADVAEAETCPVDADVFAKGDDFEEFAHFVLVGQFLYGGADTEVVCRTWWGGLCQQVGNA